VGTGEATISAKLRGKGAKLEIEYEPEEEEADVVVDE